ncbi:MAG: hypothetical protein LBH20_10120 [Treponema sp.]|jgi:hypothetical protein|nr:hypothetical protein [Treponema sp.]
MMKRICILFLALSIFALFGCTLLARNVYSGLFGRIDELSDDTFYTYITWKEMDQIRYPREEVHFFQGKIGFRDLYMATRIIMV